MNIPAEGKQTAHVLIDAVSVALDGQAEPEWVNGVHERLQSIGAVEVTATGDDDGEVAVTVDLSPLLGAALVTINYLVNEIAEARQVDRDSVIIGLREHIDS